MLTNCGDNRNTHSPREGRWSAVIEPGGVQPAMGGRAAPTPGADSARGVLAQIDRLDARTSGGFLHWQGGTTPW